MAFSPNGSYSTADLRAETESIMKALDTSNKNAFATASGFKPQANRPAQTRKATMG